MASELCTSLRLVDKDLSGKLVQVVEEHGANASFMVGSLMWNASRSSNSICLLALQNSLAHYQNVTKKLGLNLKSAIDKKSAVVLEPFDMYFEKSYPEDTAKEDTETFVEKYLDEGTKPLYEDVKRALCSMSGKKCLVIDDLSVLLNSGLGLARVLTLLQLCRGLQEGDADLALVVGCHVSESCEEHRLLADAISHVADLRLVVAPLRTGFSANVTGSLEVVDKLERACETVSQKRVFHFKLTDRQIKVFAPGSVGIHG